MENPVEVHWATESQLIATERMLRIALHHDFTLAHNISGSDWPIATRAQMVADVERDAPGCAYAEIVGKTYAERMQGFWLSSKTWRKLPDPPRVRVIRAWVAANKFLFPLLDKAGIGRSKPAGEWSKGWCWWSLPKDIAAEACDFISEMHTSGRLRGTVCSDEHVVATLLANCFSDRIRPYRRFIQWRPKESHPQTITVNDLSEIEKSGAWFARKCDLAVDDFFLTSFPAFNAV